MLMEEYVKKNKYFQAMYMKDKNQIDPLTKTINRKYIISYAKYLIKNNTPFYMCIMDIDNFKFINDTYGHVSGDEILANVSNNIMTLADDNVAIGRYGGDEFIIIVEKEKTYEGIYDTLRSLYRNGIRMPIKISLGFSLIVTATTGASCFPVDAKKYDDLFFKCDKCLYRGKFKGRNCYIIYVEKLHKDIDISKNTKTSIVERLNRMYDIFDKMPKKDKIPKVMNYLTNTLSITGISFWNKNKIKASYVKSSEYGEAPIFTKEQIELHMDDNALIVNNLEEYKTADPEFYQFCYENNLLSFILFKSEINGKGLGYVLIYDSDYKRIWQDVDIALFTVFVKMISSHTYFNNI